MSRYDQVSDALKAGAEPEFLCATCPWDRLCITPPAMTSTEVDAKLQASADEDRRKMAEARVRGEKPGDLPLGSLLTHLVIGGRDRQASLCPVFALRLRSEGGQHLAAQLRTQMRAWAS